jgi:hypothetical protein
MDPYATHIEPLIRAALGCDGAILELGCGYYSTPVLAAIAAHKGVRFTALSSHADWANRFNARFDVRPIDWTDVDFGGPWGMVFIDNEQETQDRIRHLPALRLVTRCVVIHDFQHCAKYGHWDAMREGWTIEPWSDLKPATAVLRC